MNPRIPCYIAVILLLFTIATSRFEPFTMIKVKGKKFQNVVKKAAYGDDDYTTDDLEKQVLAGVARGLTIDEPVYSIAQGWWQDVINCEQSGDVSIYCKPKDQWLWPY